PWLTALRPVRKTLCPHLAEIFRGVKGQDQAERALATSILADFAVDDLGMLAELVMDADTRQYDQLIGKLLSFRDEVPPLMKKELSRDFSAVVDDEEKERLARRQASAAVTLYRLGNFEPVWPLFKHSPDPRVRSCLIQFLPARGADPDP